MKTLNQEELGGNGNMDIEVKRIHLLHKTPLVAPVVIDATLVGSVEAILTRVGTAEVFPMKKFPYSGFSKASWLKFSFPDNAIITSHDNDALTFLNVMPDYFRVKFIDDNDHSEIFELPWLGEIDALNAGIKIERTDTDVLSFEAGFKIV